MNVSMNPRIIIAVVVGILLIGGAFWLSETRAQPTPDPRREAVTAPAPERDYITIADEDGDGIADWKQTVPKKPAWLTKQISTTTASTTATSSSHTEAFAVRTLKEMMQSNMYGEFGGNTESIINDSNAYINELATDELYTEADISVTNDQSDATLRVYGNRIATIALNNGVEKDIENELSILHSAMQTQDAEALADLQLIEHSYENMVAAMLATPVPAGYTDVHLNLVNAYEALRVDVVAMQHVFDDPLYALVRLQRYEEDGQGLYQAISDVYLQLHDDGVRWSEDDIASDFIRIDDTR